MGTGASAQAGELVQGASPEELQNIWGALSPEDRKKLQGAVAQAGAPAEGEAAATNEAAAEAAAPAESNEGAEATVEATAAPSEPAAEAEAPAEEKQAAEATAEAAAAPAEAAAEAEAPAEAKEEAEATAEATAAPAEVAAEGDNEAPFLAEYFAKVNSHTADLITNQEKLLALAVDPEAKKKLDAESKAWFEAEAKPLLEKSFKKHDINNSDVLDKNEADLFFKHMVLEQTAFAKAISALSIEAGVRMSMGMLADMSEEEREKIKPQLEEQMKEAIERAQAEVQKKEDNYVAHRAELEATAFKVLDTNGDGTLQLVEFLAAFEPGSSKNLEMHIALGYVTKEEVEEQKKREEQAAEQAGECNQQ